MSSTLSLTDGKTLRVVEEHTDVRTRIENALASSTLVELTNSSTKDPVWVNPSNIVALAEQRTKSASFN